MRIRFFPHRRSPGRQTSNDRTSEVVAAISQQSDDEFQDMLAIMRLYQRIHINHLEENLLNDRVDWIGENYPPQHDQHHGLALASKRPPPASMATLSTLPHQRILPDDKRCFCHDSTICIICCDRLIDGAALLRLPCGHVYHIHCAVAWLTRKCTCPECRYELETDSHTFEVGRRLRMKERKTVHCHCPPTMGHTCFFANPSKELDKQLRHELSNDNVDVMEEMVSCEPAE